MPANYLDYPEITDMSKIIVLVIRILSIFKKSLLF